MPLPCQASKGVPNVCVEIVGTLEGFVYGSGEGEGGDAILAWRLVRVKLIG